MDLLSMALAIKAQNRANKAPIDILRYNSDGSLKTSPIDFTARAWGTAPPSLDKITNGDADDPSGTGITSGTGTTIVGYLEADLLTSQWIDIKGKLGIWTSSGITAPIAVYVGASDTAGAFVYNNMAVLNDTTTTEHKDFLNIQGIKGRYISLKIVASPGTSNTSETSVKPYEIACLSSQV